MGLVESNDYAAEYHESRISSEPSARKLIVGLP